MPSPTTAQVHIDQALTNISVAYIQDPNNFVADKVFPIVPVQKQSDRYFKYSKDDFFRDEAEVRAPGTESAGGGYDIDNTPNYFATKYSYHKDVTEAERTNSDIPLNADRDATIWLTQKLLLKRERTFVQKYFQTGVWAKEFTGNSTAGAGQMIFWNDYQNSNPIKDIHDAQIAQEQTTGFKPNVLTISAQVYNVLQDHPLILDRIKYTERGIVTVDLLAALFGVEKVLVASAVVNSAPKGATSSIDFILGKHALLSYAPASPSLMTPSAGYTFAWTGLLGAGAYGNRISRIPMNWLEIGTERIEGDMAYDQKVVATDMGTFLDGIVQ